MIAGVLCCRFSGLVVGPSSKGFPHITDEEVEPQKCLRARPARCPSSSPGLSASQTLLSSGSTATPGGWQYSVVLYILLMKKLRLRELNELL